MPKINIIPELTAAEIARFLESVPTTEGCWIWEGDKNHLGYGRFKMRGVRYAAHRVMWEIMSGEKLTADIDVGYFHNIALAEAAVTAKRNELQTHNDRDRIAA